MYFDNTFKHPSYISERLRSSLVAREAMFLLVWVKVCCEKASVLVKQKYIPFFLVAVIRL